MCVEGEKAGTIEKLLPLSDMSVQNRAGHQPPLNKAEQKFRQKQKKSSILSSQEPYPGAAPFYWTGHSATLLHKSWLILPQSLPCPWLYSKLCKHKHIGPSQLPPPAGEMMPLGRWGNWSIDNVLESFYVNLTQARAIWEEGATTERCLHKIRP